MIRSARAQEDCCRGTTQLVRGDRAGALADFDRALEADPNYPEAYNKGGGRSPGLGGPGEGGRRPRSRPGARPPLCRGLHQSRDGPPRPGRLPGGGRRLRPGVGDRSSPCRGSQQPRRRPARPGAPEGGRSPTSIAPWSSARAMPRPTTTGVRRATPWAMKWGPSPTMTRRCGSVPGRPRPRSTRTEPWRAMPWGITRAPSPTTMRRCA
jgi:hypothetical protein